MANGKTRRATFREEKNRAEPMAIQEQNYSNATT
jgi:hypothetical protein